MNEAVRRFACTQCGKCCDRSPEVALSEAAGLADMFVFRLMFRLYSMPSRPNGGANEAFYQRKRLLSNCAAREYRKKVVRDGQTAEDSQYLILSALTLDRGSGACAALSAGRCSIYERRPAACRTAPFHYSRVEASLGSYLEKFVGTPGYACDTSETAPVAIEDSRIADQDIRQARLDALHIIHGDKSWHRAIVRRMGQPAWNGAGLPSLREVEANATLGATTTSMRLAWQIAVEAGLMSSRQSMKLIGEQAEAIDRALADGQYAHDARQTLLDMRSEYGSA